MSFSDPKILELIKAYRPVWALSRSGALLEWDVEVNMPERASESRGLIMAELALIGQERMKAVYPILQEASSRSKNLNDDEKGIVRIVERLKKYYTRIPPEILEEEQRLAVEGTVVWREARKNSDFNRFKPYLEKMLALKIKEAEKLGYEDNHPYNAMLDLGEEGLTVADMDSMFSRMIPGLKRILEKVRASGKFPSEHPLEEIKYDVQSMTAVNQKIVDSVLDMPKDRFRMDTSTHPFMTGTSRDDIRITTRYEGVDFRNTMYSVIHESGHAIYELQLDKKLNYTPISHAASTAFHESQSRFWENIVGRSMGFVTRVKPILRENLSFVSPYNDEQLYMYFNLVRPGMIRVDADELTYNFHVALRYEIEKKLFAGKMTVGELPSLWNETMSDYLGVTPPNDAQGVLQDVHWSGGSWGYFPTYSLGNIIGGMIWYNISKDLDLGELTAKGDLAPIKAWLYERIHRWGAIYPPKELARRSLGESYNPERLLQYLERKYLGN